MSSKKTVAAAAAAAVAAAAAAAEPAGARVAPRLLRVEDGKEDTVFHWQGLHYTVIHSLNGAALEYVPTYAFDARGMAIEKNSSTAFNNDKLRELFQHLPCLLENPRSTLAEFDRLDRDEHYERPFNDRNEKVESRYVAKLSKRFSLEDETAAELVTTDDLQLFLDGKELPNPYARPRLVFELRAGQEVRVVAPVMLGLGKYNESFSPCTRCFHRYDGEYAPGTVVEQVVGAAGALPPREILHRAAEVLLAKVSAVFSKIHAKPDLDNDEGYIEVDNEDYILGNLMAHALRRYMIAACHMPHLLQHRFLLYYRNLGGKNVHELFFAAHKDLAALLALVQRALRAEDPSGTASGTS